MPHNAFCSWNSWKVKHQIQQSVGKQHRHTNILFLGQRVQPAYGVVLEAEDCWTQLLLEISVVIKRQVRLWDGWTSAWVSRLELQNAECRCGTVRIVHIFFEGLLKQKHLIPRLCPKTHRSDGSSQCSKLGFNSSGALATYLWLV